MPRARIRNGNNTLLIDESYSNLALRQYTVVQTGAANPYGASFATVTLSHDQSVLAIRTSANCGIYSVSYGPGTVTYRLLATGSYVSIEIFNFDLAKYAMGINAAHAKLIIRHPSTGEVVFDSRMKYMRVMNFQYCEAGTTQPTITTTYPADTIPAMIIASQGWSQRSQQVGYPRPHSSIVSWGLSTVRMSGTTVTITPLLQYASFQDDNEGNAWPNNEMPNSFWLTIDVANLL